MNKISVAKAIQRGHLVVSLPAGIVQLVGMTLPFILSAGSRGSLLVGMFLGFILAWLYWSIAITKWKLWAYQNVEDLVALKQAAVNTYLIWPDGNIFNKTEIKSSADAEKEQAALAQAGATFVKTKSPFLTLRGIVIALVVTALIASSLFAVTVLMGVLTLAVVEAFFLK